LDPIGGMSMYRPLLEEAQVHNIAFQGS